MLRTIRGQLTYANIGTTVALVLAGTGFAVAASPSPAPKVIRGCVSKRTAVLRVPAAGRSCTKRERRISWNSVGPQGVQGPAGSTGATGATGPPGATGTVDTSSFFTKDQADARYLPSNRFSSLIPKSTAGPGSGSFGSGCVLGELIPFAGNFPPTGTAFAHGQLLSIAQNTALFSLLGTQYGGNGTTTFALPDTYGLGPGKVNWLICTSGTFPAAS